MENNFRFSMLFDITVPNITGKIYLTNFEAPFARKERAILYHTYTHTQTVFYENLLI